jgi:hypothetical protein
MPPFGNLYDLPVYVDRALAEDETIVFAVGTHTDTMSMKYADFERLVKPQPAEFAASRRRRAINPRPARRRWYSRCHANQLVDAAAGHR